MNINLRYLLILIVGLSTFSACKKYECNPLIFPLRTKKARVVNSWKYEIVLRNQLDVTAGMVKANGYEIDYTRSSVGLHDEGRFTMKTFFKHLDTTHQYDGSWKFQSDKEKLLLTYDNPDTLLTNGMEVWDLTRLQHRHLWWVENSGGDNIIEYRLTPTDESSGLFK